MQLSRPTRLGRAGAVVASLALAAVAMTGSAQAGPAGEKTDRQQTDRQQKGDPQKADQQKADQQKGDQPTTQAKARQKAPKEGGPGDVVSAEPTTFQYWPGQPTDTSAWKINYSSTSANGKANTVSGTVIVPNDGKTTPRPLITYAVGTVGMGDQCAPSAGFPDGTTAEAPLINAALVRGYAVAVTDYEGLGTPGDHTYTVAQAEGTAVLDAARAAQRMPEAQKLGVSGESPVGIMGYSQGGQASAWAAELQPSYAPELKVKGSASGGVPADLAKVAEANDGGDSAGFVLMSAVGLDTAFPELNLDKYLNDEGRKLAELSKGACVGEILEAGKGKKIEDVTVSNPLEQPDWQKAIQANKIGTKTTSAPAFLYHGEADETIPYEVGQGLRTDWCAKGVPVQWQSFPGQSHRGTAIDGNGPALEWFGQRFTDQPAPSNCA